MNDVYVTVSPPTAHSPQSEGGVASLLSGCRL